MYHNSAPVSGCKCWKNLQVTRHMPVFTADILYLFSPFRFLPQRLAALPIHSISILYESRIWSSSHSFKIPETASESSCSLSISAKVIHSATIDTTPSLNPVRPRYGKSLSILLEVSNSSTCLVSCVLHLRRESAASSSSSANLLLTLIFWVREKKKRKRNAHVLA